MFINIRTIFTVRLLKITESSCYILKSHFRAVKSTRMLSPKCYRVQGKKKRAVANLDEAEGKETPTGDLELDKILERNSLLTNSGHNVIVIQPYIKWGVLKKRSTTPQLQLLESVALIKTLRQWTVVDKKIVSLQCIRKKTVFGSGVLANLISVVRSNPRISAVFVSYNTLTVQQQAFLEGGFQIPVFDRYSIIMHIFKEHAHTKEAKLQVQLAQLPYLWTVLTGLQNNWGGKWGITGNYLGGMGPKLLTERRELFRKKAASLKKEIAELRQRRNFLRDKREKQEIPVVAVLGYTNAGKTSLIKALTGKTSLEPQDYLFATLDVTAHLGELPCGLKAYFIDTLGFISDIPTYLIESFVCTLEDAVLADVIVHVRDISHPDTVAQNEKVIEILESLKVPEETLKNLITVGNKIDLVEKEKLQDYRDLILVSSTDLTGISVLRHEVQKKILKLSNIIHIIIRVRTGSSEYFWLHESATVVKETPDAEDNQFIFIETLISPVSLSKFKHKFIKNYKS